MEAQKNYFVNKARRVGGKRVPAASGRRAPPSKNQKKKRKGKRSRKSFTVVQFNCRGAIDKNKGNDDVRLKILIAEVKKAGADCAVLVETHRSEGKEERTLDGFRIFGSDNGKNSRKGNDGVMILLACEIADAYHVNPTYVSGRMMKLEMKSISGAASGRGDCKVIIAGYGPTMTSPPVVKDAFYNDFGTKIMGDIPTGASIIMGIDANARLGSEVEPGLENVLGKFGRDVRNDNGNRLVRFAHEWGLTIVNTLFDKDPNESYSFRQNSNVAGGEKTFICLDYFLTRQAEAKHAENFKILDLTDELSDHLMLSVEFRGRVIRARNKPRTAPPESRVNLSALKDSEKREIVRAAMMEVFDELVKNGEGYTDDMFPEWAEQTRKAIEQSAGEEPKNPKLNHWLSDPLMKEQYDKSMEDMVESWNQLKANKRKWGHKHEVTRESNKRYNTCKHNLRKLLREGESAHWASIASQLMQLNGRKDSRGFHKHVKAVTGHGPQGESCHRLRSEDGPLVFGEDETRSRWAEYFSHLLNVNEDVASSIDESVLEEVEQRATNESLGAPPMRGEVAHALNSMKNCKATGPDGIPADFLKLYLESDESLQAFTDMIQKVWGNKNVPESWKKAIIKVIFKNKGTKDECGNYRGVSLLDHTGKIVLKIVANRLGQYAEAQGLLPEEQSGFRPKRSTCDMLYVVQMLQEFGRVKNVPLYFCFIDLTKAYDTVNRELLWKILAKAGVPQELIELIKAFHDGTQACVRIEGKDSVYFPVNQGLRQGCVLAPLLFNIFFAAVLEVAKKRILADKETQKDLVTVRSCMNSDPWNVAARNLKTKSGQKKEGGDDDDDAAGITFTKLWSMLYADDAAIVSKSETGLASMMSIIVEATLQFGLTVSENKTKIMYAAKKSALKAKRVTITVNAGGQSYDQVAHFTYLGSRMSESGGVAEEIAERKVKAWGKWIVRKKALYQNCGIKPNVKLAMLKQEIIETLLYGCEAWTMTAVDIAALNSIHYKLLTQTLGLWRKKKTDLPRSYSSILKGYGLWSMETEVRLRRLKWAGSVMRMSDDRLPKIMMFGELVEGKRNGGGQLSQWRADLLGDMISFGWIVKEEDMSKTAWDKYKANIWDAEISVTAREPVDWADAIQHGAVHFMKEWHGKQDKLSTERGEARAVKHVRLVRIVLGGWVPMAERRDWEKWEAEMKEIRYLACQAYEDFEVGKRDKKEKKKKKKKKEGTRWGMVFDVKAPEKKRTKKSEKDWKVVQRELLEFVEKRG